MRQYLSILQGAGIACLLWLSACGPAEPPGVENQSSPSSAPLFTQLSSDSTGIEFINYITETEHFNYLRYVYMYNGGGVAIGDVDGDGLEDVLLGANQLGCKLYKNLGGLRFEDITERAGVQSLGGWTTGLNMVDIDNDGDLDIYICKSASLDNEPARRNQLFINNGSGEFREAATLFGLDHAGFCTQSYFFDQDQDGDMDLFLLNHRIKVSAGEVKSWRNEPIDPLQSDRFFINEEGVFRDVTARSGIENQCWGLSASLGDFNQDGLTDIYVCNDFREGDLLYLNQGNGRFAESIDVHFMHTSFYSMGSDFADVNNDLLQDLIVADMSPDDHQRSKQNMAAMDVDVFNDMVDAGYQHQYMFNVLQLGSRYGQYRDISQLAGVSKSDWSWAPLLSDLDNDGQRDIFISNGILRDVNDRDYKLLLENRFRSGNPMRFDEALNKWPGQKISNKTYRNMGEGQFEDVSSSWGLDQASWSNGAASADLDQDGDLDLIVNNVGEKAFVYRNESSSSGLTISLSGPEGQAFAEGARILLTQGEQKQIAELQRARGYLSSLGSFIHFGLADQTDCELSITWPDGRHSTASVKAGTTFVQIEYPEQTSQAANQNEALPVQVRRLTSALPHKENRFDDYAREPLLPQQMSGLGPCLASEDVNGDGVLDLFIGGAKGQAPQLLISQNGSIHSRETEAIESSENIYEDLGAAFFDADGDGDLDLVVVSGGNESEDMTAYPVRLYLHDGAGKFHRDEGAIDLHVSGQAICLIDYDNDEDMDLFIAGRQVPGRYGESPDSYLLQNDGTGHFTADNSHKINLHGIGMVTDCLGRDTDGDGWDDLVLVGEWMNPTILKNSAGNFDRSIALPGRGWWYSIVASDIDGDGDLDLIAGNLGTNNKFHPSSSSVLELYAGDIDGNSSHDIVLSKRKDGTQLPVRGRDCSSAQVPSLLHDFPSYTAFSEAQLGDIYGQEALDSAYVGFVDEFASMLFLNEGEDKFKPIPLPSTAQYGPIMDMAPIDLDEDGHMDLIIAGGIYDVENETTRYDAGQGAVLFGNGRGGFATKPEYTGLLPYPIKALSIAATDEQSVEVYTVENSGYPKRLTITRK